MSEKLTSFESLLSDDKMEIYAKIKRIEAELTALDDTIDFDSSQKVFDSMMVKLWNFKDEVRVQIWNNPPIQTPEEIKENAKGYKVDYDPKRATPDHKLPLQDSGIQFSGTISNLTKYDIASYFAVIHDFKTDDMGFAVPIKISAKLQRKMFDYVPFGKQSVWIDPKIGTGYIDISVKTAFGQDTNHATYDYESFAKAINQKKDLKAY